MTDRLRVFISYKKLPGHLTPPYAYEIAAHLKQATPPLEVFLDDISLNTADEWATRIYREIHRSDVLVLLLVPEVVTSPWVQREVDVARGAGVSIIQLVIGERTGDDIAEAANKLALDHQQYAQFQGTPADYERLIKDIRRLALDTRERQRMQHREREQHWFEMPLDFRWKHLSYRMKNGALPNTTIHITVGDILAMPPGELDVLVNSENDYLQMARFYQMRSLSGALRINGALIEGGRLVEDTVQEDLCAAYKGALPVALCQVFVTKAGHADSELRVEKRLKLIFHAITVQYAIGHETMPVQPMNKDQFFTTIRNCFRQVQAVNDNAEFRTAIDPHFEAITRIAFPLFGTGGSVLSIMEGANYLVNGLYRALTNVINQQRDSAFSLTDIHLLAYSSGEIQPLQSALNELFEPIPAN